MEQSPLLRLSVNRGGLYRLSFLWSSPLQIPSLQGRSLQILISAEQSPTDSQSTGEVSTDLISPEQSPTDFQTTGEVSIDSHFYGAVSYRFSVYKRGLYRFSFLQSSPLQMLSLQEQSHTDSQSKGRLYTDSQSTERSFTRPKRNRLQVTVAIFSNLVSDLNRGISHTNNLAFPSQLLKPCTFSSSSPCLGAISAYLCLRDSAFLKLWRQVSLT